MRLPDCHKPSHAAPRPDTACATARTKRRGSIITWRQNAASIRSATINSRYGWMVAVTPASSAQAPARRHDGRRSAPSESDSHRAASSTQWADSAAWPKRMASGGLRTNSIAPISWRPGCGVTSRISKAPNSPCSAKHVTSQMPMNWKVGGSSGSSSLNRAEASGIESVRPTELPTGQMRCGVAPRGSVHGLVR